MYMQQSLVKCESGLYNRQATYFIQKANEFKSSIWIEVEDRKINAKSLLGVLSMGITKGTRVSYLSEFVNDERWVYVETTVEDKPARGFVPADCVSYQETDE